MASKESNKTDSKVSSSSLHGKHSFPVASTSQTDSKAKTLESIKKKFSFKKLPTLKQTSSSMLVTRWDPLNSNDWKTEKPSSLSIMRVKKDVMEMFKDPPSGIYIYPDDDDLTLVYALITGASGTPYEGGFFLFVIRFPPQYPIYPPRVRLLTTDKGKVRFNPNLYKDGKVCLSILGTWSGPSWSAAQTLSTVLISIQSLMNEHPYLNEPGFENRKGSDESKRYNEHIQHETIRVAVCGMLEGKCDMCPAYLIEIAKTSFEEHYDHYIDVCKKKQKNDGKSMMNRFNPENLNFHYGELLKRLNAIHDDLSKNKDDSQPSSNTPCCSSTA